MSSQSATLSDIGELIEAMDRNRNRNTYMIYGGDEITERIDRIFHRKIVSESAFGHGILSQIESSKVRRPEVDGF